MKEKFTGKLRIKAGDNVIVLSGKDKGKSGKVLRAYPKTGKVLVEGINIITKHEKGVPTPANPNPEGGIKKVEAPLLACKVALTNSEGKATRIRIQTAEDGTKQRVAVKGGGVIPEPERK
jgi:large subunit ribosomal protein L24